MGICYQLIMEDEWDWEYSGKDKNAALKDFEEEFGGYVDKIAEWHHCVVYDIDKHPPYTEDNIKIISKYCERAYYRTDLGNGIVELEFPKHPDRQSIYEKMVDRLTPEQKTEGVRKAAARLKELSKEHPEWGEMERGL